MEVKGGRIFRAIKLSKSLSGTLIIDIYEIFGNLLKIDSAQ